MDVKRLAGNDLDLRVDVVNLLGKCANGGQQKAEK